ncbi:hypothetical protein SAMN06265375_102524 [Muriicola jejuensis]|uniref:Uncharacterized protein n=1 Tax=Muriicola jejuensis TaxID=504488 RepID=A0A6P0UB20_9FLAO|nr:hypothetical protein [Muriicola jejuensis]NER10501.1 hypothetical protein [Muriicola jejuensis]SMP18489.1 hypothetical protein SAMN06265375_102524 [Muriicola jejuensis]
MKSYSLIACVILGFQLSAQQVGQPAPSLAGETIPYSNFHQRWAPMMQKLFQQVRDDDEIVTHFVGAEVGSPYELEEFEKGSVFYEDDNLGEYYYRYNIFSSEVELKRTLMAEEKQQALIRDPKVVLIPKTGNLGYHYLPFTTSKGDRLEGYLLLLYRGENFKIYKHLESKFTEAKPAANSMVNPIPSRFSTFTSYFLQADGGDIAEVSLKKNRFLKELNDPMADKVKQFMKEEGIDLSDESQLIRTVAQMDLLAKQ